MVEAKNNPSWMDKWPLSLDDLRKYKPSIYQKIDFVKVMTKYSKSIEEWPTHSFTHKCTCPNKFHKGGNERTASFFFSEEDKTFVCFGCSINGDVIDIISLMEGMPWWTVLRNFINKYNISSTETDDVVIQQHNPMYINYVFNIHLNLSAELRDYLKEFKNTEKYVDEQKWVDNIFKRMDDRFDKITDSNHEAAKVFQMEILKEVMRRKLEAQIMDYK